VAEEIEKRKAQIRDIIIITLSSKSYEEVSSREGKDQLRNEIKDTINNFLTKGKIKNVFFTDLIYN
jgi:flagellar FliL protein